jgi:hypothetical protein
MPEFGSSSFHHSLVQGEGVVCLIRSMCKTCGEWKVVSAVDGTVFKWEREHKCKPANKCISLAKR